MSPRLMPSSSSPRHLPSEWSQRSARHWASRRHLLKPCSGKMKHVFATAALEAFLAAAHQPLRRLHRDERILLAQRDDAIEVFGPGKLLAHQSIPQPSQLVPVQVVEELVKELRRRALRRPDAVLQQSIEHVRAILE